MAQIAVHMDHCPEYLISIEHDDDSLINKAQLGSVLFYVPARNLHVAFIL